MAQTKPKLLDAKTGWTAFAACWLAMFAVVWALRQATIPRDELSCYARASVLDEAVHAFNRAHPEKPMDDKGEIDEKALVDGRFLAAPLTYDTQAHYYFVDRTVRGLKVKCNKHEDNPPVLKLTGVTLLALLAFVAWASFKNYALWKD